MFGRDSFGNDFWQIDWEGINTSALNGGLSMANKHCYALLLRSCEGIYKSI